MFAWSISHPETKRAEVAIDSADIVDLDLEEILKRAKERAWAAFQKKRRSKDQGASDDAAEEGDASETPLPDRMFFDDYEEMSDIEDWHDQTLPDELPAVIPEWYL
jgi:hypothetical protein